MAVGVHIACRTLADSAEEFSVVLKDATWNHDLQGGLRRGEGCAISLDARSTRLISVAIFGKAYAQKWTSFS